MVRESDFEGKLSEQESLRQAEAEDVVAKINDPRLRANEDLEYFTLHLKEAVRHVPKRRIHEPENTNRYIESHIRSILQKEK